LPLPATCGFKLKTAPRQIIFFSPSSEQMDALEEQMLIAPGTRRDIVRNNLVLITPAENELNLTSFADLLNDES
jgi:molybdate transport system substrate-binding protein